VAVTVVQPSQQRVLVAEVVPAATLVEAAAPVLAHLLAVVAVVAVQASSLAGSRQQLQPVAHQVIVLMLIVRALDRVVLLEQRRQSAQLVVMGLS